MLAWSFTNATLARAAGSFGQQQTAMDLDRPVSGHQGTNSSELHFCV